MKKAIFFLGLILALAMMSTGIVQAHSGDSNYGYSSTNYQNSYSNYNYNSHYGYGMMSGSNYGYNSMGAYHMNSNNYHYSWRR